MIIGHRISEFQLLVITHDKRIPPSNNSENDKRANKKWKLEINESYYTDEMRQNLKSIKFHIKYC